MIIHLNVRVPKRTLKKHVVFSKLWRRKKKFFNFLTYVSCICRGMDSIRVRCVLYGVCESEWRQADL